MDETDGLNVSCNRLVMETYDELRRIAGRYFQQAGGTCTLQPTAIVHEAYLKLAVADSSNWKSDTHFFAVAAKAVRQVLLDHARSHRRLKRGGEGRALSLDTSILSGHNPDADALEVEEVLCLLENRDARAAAVVELRFFGGMSIDQVATHLSLSTATIERDWRFARAWLYNALFNDNDDDRLGERDDCAPLKDDSDERSTLGSSEVDFQ